MNIIIRPQSYGRWHYKCMFVISVAFIVSYVFKLQNRRSVIQVPSLKCEFAKILHCTRAILYMTVGYSVPQNGDKSVQVSCYCYRKNH